MGRKKTQRTKHPGIYRVPGKLNTYELRIKVKVPYANKPVERRPLFEGTLSEAVLKREELIDQIKQGRMLARTHPTVVEYIELFVERRAPAWKRSHREFMGVALGSAAEALGDIRLDHLQPEDIQRWLLGLKGRHGGDAATSTRKNFLNRLRAVLDMAVLESYIDRNPADRRLVTPPRGRPPREPVVLNPTQCQSLVGCAGKYDQHLHGRPGSPYMGHQVYVELALTTGCRSGELTALRWDEHVNLADGTLDVVQSHWRGTLDTRKTSRRDRLYLPGPLIEHMGRHWQLLQTKGTPAQKDSGLVFPSRRGTLSSGRVRNCLLWCCKRLGFPPMTPHDLRHTATTLWSQSAPRRVSQLVIGHDDDRTHDHYTHPYEEEFKAGSAAVAGLIGLKE